MLLRRKYREGLQERLGRVPSRLRDAAAGRQIVWVHAVSVGEVLAASEMVEQLQKTLDAGDEAVRWTVLVSTTTPTGQALARQRFGEDRVFWFPLDFAWAVRAWLKVLEPKLLVLMESEIWPRLVAECARAGVPVAVANARLSDRSYRRAVRVRRLWVRVLRLVTLFLAQSDETAVRLRALGVADECVETSGNLKYDIAPRQTPMLAALRSQLGRHSLLVAGSLLEPEERLLLGCWEPLHKASPDTLLLLAPRHPERFAEVARMVREQFPLVLASDLLQAHERGERPGRLALRSVVLLDTVGDLAGVYGLAEAAFVGGSLVRKGGHNPLEPARLGIPVVMGPSYENFREIVHEMQRSDGIRIVHNGEELARVLSRLLRDRVEADALGQRGQQVFAHKSGATGRTVTRLAALAMRDVVRAHPPVVEPVR